MSDKILDTLDEIEKKVIILIIKYNKLIVDYDNNCKILDKYVPKVGQKRKRSLST